MPLLFPHLTLVLCLIVLPISPLPYLSVHSTFLLSLPCLPSSFMFGVNRVTPPHYHGHARRCADVCVCVCVQGEQAADSWAKAKTYTLLREGDSKEEREVE